MEGSIKNHDKEHMKMVMLKQEETFRYQVHELHRLYRIQMLLTRDSKNAKMERQRINFESWNEENGPTDLEFTAEDCKGENSEVMIEDDEESHLELTLATGISRTTQWKKKKEEDSTFASDSGSSFSSSSNESGTMKQYRNEWASFEGPYKSTRFRNVNNGLKVEQQMRLNMTW